MAKDNHERAPYFSALLPYAINPGEIRHIEAVIAHDGNQTQAAAALGVSRSTIRSSVSHVRQRAEKATAGELVPVGQRLKGKSTFVTPDGTSTWTKTERTPEEPEQETPEERPGFTIASESIMRDRSGLPLVRWTRVVQERADAFEAMCDAVRAVAEEHAAGRAAPSPAPVLPHDAAEWLNVVPFGDPHIGLLAWGPESGAHHDTAIGVRDLRTAIDLALADAPPARIGYFLNLGDYFHAQDNSQLTPGHGHKLDVDGRWNKVLRAGIGAQIYCIDQMLKTHEEVWAGNVPGNHDLDAARLLAIVLEAWYRNEPRVRVLDNASPYHAIQFGENMICTAHGDGAKREALPGLFAARFRQMWGATSHRRCYSGHIHHEVVKEFEGMTVENFRTLAAKDAWHAHKGFGSGQSVDVCSHHVRHGLRRRSRIDIAEIRESQGGGR
jgi:hypothetical protein